MKRISIVVATAMLFPMTALAQAEGYIQINNGDIVTNAGQRFQVVAQFGNTGDEILEDVAVACLWTSTLADLGRVYTHGVFDVVSSADVPDDEEVGFLLEAVYGGSERFFLSDGTIDIAPGQNYNFSFDLHVDAPSGDTGFVLCFLTQTTEELFPGFNADIIGDAFSNVTVQ